MTAPRPIRFDDQIIRDAAAMRAAMPRVVRPDPDALPLNVSADVSALTDAQKFKLLGDILEGAFAVRSDDLADAMLPIIKAYQAAYDECRAIVDYEAGERGQ